ncbi:MAG TPA: phosphatase PAP2 family protein [Solirubrobacteraceae bacterium]|nr:phosphatase PAP2 family protein [Solirubrobacteraceae bacterium]
MALSGALLLLVIGLHMWLVWVGNFPGDVWALEQGWYPQSNALNGYANFFQELCTPAVATLIVVVVLGVLLRHKLLRDAAGLVVACVAVALNALLKLVLGPSPLWVEAHRAGHNFPSGHVTFVTAVIGYMGLVAWRHGRWWLAALAVALIIGVGPARVVTGIHLVSDCVAGYLLGAAMLVLAAQFVTQTSRKESRWNIANSEAPA